MLLLIATFKVAPENQAAFEAILSKLSATTRANEPGVITYQLGKVQDNETTYRVVEAYESEDAFNSHMMTEWFQSAFPKFGPLLAEPPVMEKLTPIG
jgi:quinol monooxygenase YgiN